MYDDVFMLLDQNLEIKMLLDSSILVPLIDMDTVIWILGKSRLVLFSMYMVPTQVLVTKFVVFKAVKDKEGESHLILASNLYNVAKTLWN